MWTRIIYFAVGAILVIVALFKLTGDNQLSTTTKAAIGLVVKKKL